MNKFFMYAGLSIGSAVMASPVDFVTGADPRIGFSDCLRVVRDADSGVARVDRVLENARGYRWDAPGARVRCAGWRLAIR
jgi:hypothetical protein